ncbi:hypothetical protein FisN_25Hu012 [Fistulifera solaris]|uniref:DDE Tnp4 domain-containing protein n=1 Tax=Fistulifera solaris TaxID=1519565 RepID=A0A1Z5JW43_FISSO|nr:hypothetical protein FisN_25Hu012 [Fistulifera solaris]|eukprot:GAX18038.1 hypothetical protein FisN_25Hu012 [Fistulifera solaris]
MPIAQELLFRDESYDSDDSEDYSPALKLLKEDLFDDDEDAFFLNADPPPRERRRSCKKKWENLNPLYSAWFVMYIESARPTGNFFHLFVDFCSTVLYKQYVDDYRTEYNLSNDRTEYAYAGFPGAVGSLDATHVSLERCTMSSAIQHKGFKLTHTARTYNITVNHRRYIMSTTKGCPASWNDKSIIRFDKLAMGAKDTDEYDYLSFGLYERVEGGTRVQTYNGAWFIVDNGYQPWSIFVPPYKTSDNDAQKRWSQWLESVRKDVECTFGILKGRWRILKYGCRLFGTDKLDKVFLACCALHNLLLEKDGLNEGWEKGAKSDWEGNLGYLDPDDIPVRMRASVLQYAHRLKILKDRSGRLLLHSNGQVRVATEGNEAGPNDNNATGSDNNSDDDDDDEEDDDDDDDDEDEAVDISVMNRRDENGHYTVRNLTLKFFRQKLVEHFDICYEMNKIYWPRATSEMLNALKKKK